MKAKESEVEALKVNNHVNNHILAVFIFVV